MYYNMPLHYDWFFYRTGDMEAAASHLQSMNASLDVLKNSPDYEDKVKHSQKLLVACWWSLVTKSDTEKKGG